jgi:putative membrane-bound dehydrogenase-like protein
MIRIRISPNLNSVPSRRTQGDRECLVRVISLRTLLAILLIGGMHSPLVAADPKDELAEGATNLDEPAAEKWNVELPRTTPTEPNQVSDTLTVQPEVKFELVVHEPQVVDPVAMAFDEAGALYVVEMRDYSEQAEDRLGRVRRLTDVNGDGVYETSTVFFEGLSWPTAVCCYDGGIYVAAAPDVIFLRDGSADGVADEQNVIFTGLGRSNVQGLVNSFQWGLDNRIYAAVSSSGAQFRHVANAEGGVMQLQGRDLCFDPRTHLAEPMTGGGQHGMSFNRWGDRFVCSNSDHLQAIVFEERYLHRNPYQSAPGARRSIAVDGPQAEVYRTSQVEPWRVLRTKMRVSGFSPGLIEGGGRASGYFTSATGVTIDEGGLNANFALIADVGSNLIHRKRLIPDGVTYRGERIDDKSELVASSDNWFRPVQMCLGPDGAIYVADMYREVIEHPQSLPPEIKRQLDLTSGNDRGRIYRLAPAAYKYVPPTPLAGATTAELVHELEHPNQWRRTTAARLLYERQDKSAAPLLAEQMAATTNPVARVSLLYALDGQGELEDTHLLVALADAHPQVRRHALRLAESRLDASPALFDAALQLTTDPELIVRFRLALSMGASADRRVAGTLARLAQTNTDRDVIAATLVSAHSCAGAYLKRVVMDSAWRSSPTGKLVVGALISQIKQQKQPEDIAELVQLLDSKSIDDLNSPAVATTIAVGAIEEESIVNTSLARAWRQALALALPLARQVLGDAKTSPAERVTAVKLLALADLGDSKEALIANLAAAQNNQLAGAIVATLAQRKSPHVAEIMLAAWSKLDRELQESAADLLCTRSEWACELLEACEAKQLNFTDLPTTCATALCNFPEEQVRQRARELRGQADPVDRQIAFKDYREVLGRQGDKQKGSILFAEHCAVCHQVEGKGYAIGPSLTSMASRGGESLLYNILAPNAEIDPRYAAVTIVTVDGRVLTGIVAAESGHSLTLKGAKGELSTVLRVDIDELLNSGASLMPEGFEKSLTKAAMADLLAYLQASTQTSAAKE